MNSDHTHLLKWIFIGSLALLIYFCGLLTGIHRLLPAQIWLESVSALKDWEDNWVYYLGIKEAIPNFAVSVNHDFAGVDIYDKELVDDRLMLIAGFWGEGSAVRLVDLDANVLHEWRLPFEDLWADTPDMLNSTMTIEQHIGAAHLYPTGNLLVTYHYGGIALLNPDSGVIWRIPIPSHHSLDVDETGNIWVPSKRLFTDYRDEYPNLEPPYWDDLLVKISPDGEILEQISLFDIIYHSDLKGILFANGTRFPVHFEKEGGDITHLNDIEVLSTEKAMAFPLFDAGDMLISVRNLNLIAVIDGKDYLIKWHMIGPFLRQHDPDFLDDGTISVFDNHSEVVTDVPVFGQSRILVINPNDNTCNLMYSGAGKEPFFSRIKGDHTILSNNHLLITVSTVGRLFEVTPDGKVVWSYYSRYDSNHTAMIASSYPIERSAYPFHEILNEFKSKVNSELAGEKK